jgi:hypothetical protein
MGSLASEFTSPIIWFCSFNEADKETCDFTVSIASAYRLSTRRDTILDWKCEIPGLDPLLKYK